MKRDEMDDFLASLIPTDPPLPAQWVVDRETMMRLLSLARLGASVAAPTEEEIEAMAKAMVVGPHPDELIPMSDGTKMVRRPAWTAKKWSVERVLEELLALKDPADV